MPTRNQLSLPDRQSYNYLQAQTLAAALRSQEGGTKEANHSAPSSVA